MAIRIALDAMGGDFAPEKAVLGAVNALRQTGDKVEILLVGQQTAVQAALDATGYQGGGIHIIDAPEVIDMGESPAVAVKTKTRSSIHIGTGLHKAGKADVFISAGNTGAVLGASLFILGRLPGVMRPSVLGYYPTTQGWCIIVDAGTNVDCKPEHLVQFAQMGSVFVQKVMKVENPTVGLMNIGEEPGKGNELVKAAFELLRTQKGIQFLGNIEGRDLLHHAADVVVADGFVGNVMLKLGEGIATAIREMAEAEMVARNLPEEEQTHITQVVRGAIRRFDYQEVGGAPLLGVNGNVLIMHGSSKEMAFEQIIYRGIELAESNIPAAISDAFATTTT